MRRRSTLRGARTAWLLAPGLLLLAGVLALGGESRVRIVVISYLSHQVQVQRPEPAVAPTQPLRWTTAMLNAPVTEGESIRTRINSDAEVELECGSALRLAPQSELTFNRLRLRDDGTHVTTVTVRRGEAFFTMQDEDSRDFHAHIGAAVISMPNGGAKLRLNASADQPASVEVLNGQILVQVGEDSQTVHATRRIEFEPGRGIRKVALLKPDEWQLWSKRRDDAFQRAVLASGPKPPAQFSAAAAAPAAASNAPMPASSYDPEAILGGFKTLDKGHGPTSAAPRQGPTPAVPYCAHRG